jgi:hypothetical protein
MSIIKISKVYLKNIYNELIEVTRTMATFIDTKINTFTLQVVEKKS